jgi:hypothetical protein
MFAYISILIQPVNQTSNSTILTTTTRISSATVGNKNEDEASDVRSTMADGIWSPLLEDWALSVVPRDQKVMKNKPYLITRPGDMPAVGGNKEVTETDLYLLGAIEKLVYRVDFMEKRLRRTEELLYHVMANSNKNHGNWNGLSHNLTTETFGSD